jgi:HD domain/Domain of unknown function (DUF4388)
MEGTEAGAWLLRSVQRPALKGNNVDLLHLGALEIVALTAEYRRLASGGHNQRVGQLAALLAKQLGLPEAAIALIQNAAPLHDVGTIFIPEKILLKPGKLLPEEFEVVKGHVNLGLKLLGQGQSDMLRMARLIVETHHERFDGHGYPNGLKGVQIPLIGQIVTVADVFDSLSHDQPYRPALTKENALAEILQQKNIGFDPQVVEALAAVMQESYWLARPIPETIKESKTPLLEGRLDVLNLFELLTTLTQNQTSGLLELAFEGSSAQVWLEGGRIIHATLHIHQGEEALFNIFTMAQHDPKTRFVLTELTSSEITIHKNAQQLLFDIALALDNRLRGER